MLGIALTCTMYKFYPMDWTANGSFVLIKKEIFYMDGPKNGSFVLMIMKKYYKSE